LDDILDLSKIEAGKLEIEPLQIDILAMAQDCIRTFRAQAQQKGLDLVLAETTGLPPVLVGDPVRLRQVIANLVGNAVKFTERGRIEVTAEVESIGKEEVIARFCVADTGIGISKSKQAIIFEPFRQADQSTTRKSGGTGLGLTISARLVGLMGGRMWVESEEGNGSRFWFSARFGLPSCAECLSPRPAPDAREHAGATRPLRILLAEDNPVNQKLATRLLERHGHSVRVAQHGIEAVAFAAEETFDLILMDVQMPAMDGYTATRRIREREGEGEAPHVPIVAMTACAMKGDREKCLDAGMDAYVPKPIDIDALLAVIAKVGPAGQAAAGSPTDE
jgi:CheY-like chemotaxis protein